MKCIQKFTVPIDGGAIEMPVHAIDKHVAGMGKVIHLWAIVDPDYLTEIRHFEVYQTGDRLPLSLDAFARYVGTAICDEGLVWHVFERIQDC